MWQKRVVLCRVPQNELTGEVCSRWEWYPPLPVCSNFMQTLKFFCVCAICRQTNHVGLCVLYPSSPWIIGCRVQSDPEHQPVCLVHGQACVSTRCLRACSYTLITGNIARGGGRAGRPAVCSHDCAVLWQKESERWETEGEWGLWCRAGKAEERSCKYTRLRGEESGRQTAAGSESGLRGGC